MTITLVAIFLFLFLSSNPLASTNVPELFVIVPLVLFFTSTPSIVNGTPSPPGEYVYVFPIIRDVTSTVPLPV